MKKMFLSLIGIASIATASAQFSLGAKAGASLTDFTGGSYFAKESKMKVGYYGGAYGRFHFTKNIAAQAEVLYATQGAKIEDGDGDYDHNLNYITVPVMFQYHLPVGLYVETGPQVSFLTKAEKKDGDAKLDLKDVTKKVDFGWVAGVGYKITDEIGVNARYNFGIADLNDGEFGGKAHNTAIQLGISWKLFGK